MHVFCDAMPVRSAYNFAVYACYESSAHSLLWSKAKVSFIKNKTLSCLELLSCSWLWRAYLKSSPVFCSRNLIKCMFSDNQVVLLEKASKSKTDLWETACTIFPSCIFHWKRNSYLFNSFTCALKRTQITWLPEGFPLKNLRSFILTYWAWATEFCSSLLVQTWAPMWRETNVPHSVLLDLRSPGKFSNWYFKFFSSSEFVPTFINLKQLTKGTFGIVTLRLDKYCLRVMQQESFT